MVFDRRSAACCVASAWLAACSGQSRGAQGASVSPAPSIVQAQAMPAPVVPAAPAAPAATNPPPAAAPPTPSADQSRVARALHYDDKDPLADLEKADELDRSAGKLPSVEVPAPARGCALQGEPRRLWSAPGIANVAAIGGGFVIAGYVQSPKLGESERLFVVYWPANGLPEPVATLRVEPPHPVARLAPPGLAAEPSAGATLAFTDGAGVLFMQRLQVGSAHGAGAKTELARGVDTRFAPAVTYTKRGPLIAYTLGTTPMRSVLARIGARGELLGSHEITPPAMGAAAPAFVQGASPPQLITADARNGMSPIARTPLSEDGKPQPGQDVVPVGMMSQPAQLTAARASFGSFAAYTGLGSAATSAVGLVQLGPKSGAPTALVKGTAYGPLHVAAAASNNALLFAADAPLSAGKAPMHDIVLVRVDERGAGPALHIAAPGGDATQVALARSDDGRVLVVFTGKDAVYAATARCQP